MLDCGGVRVCNMEVLTEEEVPGLSLIDVVKVCKRNGKLKQDELCPNASAGSTTVLQPDHGRRGQ